MHSDPKSQDSLVFCEECKIETKNKNLRNSLLVSQIVSRCVFQKDCLEKITKLLV